jgi:dipeptidyl aminopeptidase/acylaminoacyl peptidase
MVLVVACAGTLFGQERRPATLSIETALAQPSFQPYSSLTLSPDGSWVAYSLIYPNRLGPPPKESWFGPTGVPSTASGARVRITELGTGHTLTVGDQSATSWAPAWSPDGRYLAYYSDAGGVAHLWVRDMVSGRTRPVGKAIVRAHRAMQHPRWTPDSRKILLPILPYGTAIPEARIGSGDASRGAVRCRDSAATVTVLRADPAFPYGGQAVPGNGMSNRESLHADLALVDVTTGGVTTIAHDAWPLEFAISANGEYAAYTSEQPLVNTGRWLVPYDVVVVPIGQHAAGAPDTVAANVAVTNFAVGMFWSPKSATLLYSATDTTGHERYYVADSSDWRPREVATSGVAAIHADSIPANTRSFWWSDTGDAFYVVRMHSIVAVSVPDGIVRSIVQVPEDYQPLVLLGTQANESARTQGERSLVVAFRNNTTKEMGFAKVDLGAGAWHVLLEGNRHLGKQRDLLADVARDGRTVYLSEDAQHPADVWLAQPDFASTRQLTHVAPEMERIAFGETRLIDFTIRSSARRRATLLLPAGYRAGTRYPLVVYPYPVDDRSNDVNVFGVTGSGVENMQLLATRGIAVLAPDVSPFDWSDQMHALADIILPGIDRVIALGIADSTRLGIMGQSWGGYTTLALIAQSPRFRAAIMRGGIGDQVTMTGTLQAGGTAYGLKLGELWFGGTVWERPELYHRNSPIYFLDHVHTPLLIIHGADDSTVPLFLAGQVYAGLQRLGREVEFASYKYEDHNESRWSYANQRDYLARMIGWFESHLRDGSEHRGSRAPVQRR